MAALVTSLLLVAPVLLMLRRWRLPYGAATTLFLVVATTIVALDNFEAWETSSPPRPPRRGRRRGDRPSQAVS